MKQIKTILTFVLFILGHILFSQGPSFYDLTFQADSIVKPYISSNNNRVYLKSKRGSNGMNTTSSGDSIKGFSISKIVLVFTEESGDDIANREEYNQERWENLIMTYPEYFQAKTIYQNMCQCTAEAGGDDYKAVQGFYVYYVAKGGTPPPKKAEPVAIKTEAPAKVEKPAETPKKTAVLEEPVAKKQETPVTKTEPAPVTKTEAPAVTKTEAAPVTKTEEVKKEPEPVAKETEENTENVVKKKPGAVLKPKRSKDTKACRPACYGGGDEDLNAFFKDNIKLSKKQKKKWKSATSELKLQLNFDGSIKKSMVAGANTDLNKLVLDCAAAMNNWNAAVKNGVTIKSEVRIVLKFDKETKSFKPSEVIVNPRPNAKCKCVSDSELFGE